MNVSDAMMARKSVRAFTDEPIDNEVLESLLAKAARAPSGGNVQPWRIFVINGDAMSRFRQVVREKRAPEPAEYAIYPDGLKDPYRTARFNVGEQMYALLNIPREDKPARLRRLAENFNFLAHRQLYSVMSTVRWAHPSGLIWACFFRALCCLLQKQVMEPVLKRLGRIEPKQ